MTEEQLDHWLSGLIICFLIAAFFSADYGRNLISTLMTCGGALAMAFAKKLPFPNKIQEFSRLALGIGLGMKI